MVSASYRDLRNSPGTPIALDDSGRNELGHFLGAVVNHCTAGSYRKMKKKARRLKAAKTRPTIDVALCFKVCFEGGGSLAHNRRKILSLFTWSMGVFIRSSAICIFQVSIWEQSLAPKFRNLGNKVVCTPLSQHAPKEAGESLRARDHDLRQRLPLKKYSPTAAFGPVHPSTHMSYPLPYAMQSKLRPLSNTPGLHHHDIIFEHE